MDIIRQIIDIERPDAIMLFTDPRYFTHIFQAENEIRSKIPIIYYNIWDDTLFVPNYNKPYYESCDALFGISRQTTAMNKIVLGKKTVNKIIKYIPHGVNEKYFFPVDKNDTGFKEFKKHLVGDKEYEFIMLFNSRNIRRKNIPDTMVAWKLFCDKIGEEKASKCAFVLHTEPVSEHGTDLLAVKEMLFDLDNPKYNIIFSSIPLAVNQMNYLYNLSNAVILLTSNEGYGIALNEARMCGKMIIPAIQGGMVCQCRFENENGDWLDFEEGFMSNSYGDYMKHGEWAIPVKPTNISLVGSVPTPYIADVRIDFRDAAKAIEECYNLGDIERSRRGETGRQWTLGSESKMTSKYMCEGMIEGINELFEKWKPKSRYELIKIEDKKHSDHYNNFNLDKYGRNDK